MALENKMCEGARGLHDTREAFAPMPRGPAGSPSPEPLPTVGLDVVGELRGGERV